MIFGPNLREELGRVALLLTGAIIGGLLLGQLAVVVSIALLGYLLITLLQLAQLERRLEGGWRRNEHEMPDGLWRAIDDHLHDAATRDRRRRREAVGLMRAFRDATAAMPDAVVWLNPDWGIRWANPSALDLLEIGRASCRERV